MTEAITPTETVTPAVTPAVTVPAPPQEGFVPVAELESERQRARTFQAELDRTKAELARLTTTPTPAPPKDSGFDQASFRNEILGSVYAAQAMANAAVALKAEFPNADPSIFSPEKLTTFGSVEALRIAAEADHSRVSQASSPAVEAALAAQRAQYLAAYGVEAPTGPTGGTITAPGGDPTPAELVAMGMDALAELERTSPGTADRVLRNAA